MSHDRARLDLAARLALRGAGRVEPNPMVGCVIERHGRLIGLGHHMRFGGLHAENEALNDCARRGEDPRGGTVYCTLEPCNGVGAHPPCVRALIEAGIARVVFARRDPNPLKRGGMEALHAAGIDAVCSDASALAAGVGAPFVKRVETGMPWVIAKWAQTIDGRIATRTGESRWISSERSRRRVHRLRARVDAILTGIGTALADDPLLTARGVTVRRVARRVVADSDLDLPPDSKLARTADDAPVLVACHEELVSAGITASRVRMLTSRGVKLLGVARSPKGWGIDLAHLLRVLAGEHEVSTLLVEAGPGLLGSLFDADLVDEAVVHVAPMMLGDEHAKAVATGRVAESLGMANRFRLWRVKPLGDDVELTYRAR
jgi:diaminohydroxyphosphoribosylaminopyrimidine deaminase/5-amino-6-(5-phosphoribosylamino)uracil reductase